MEKAMTPAPIRAPRRVFLPEVIFRLRSVVPIECQRGNSTWVPLVSRGTVAPRFRKRTSGGQAVSLKSERFIEYWLPANFAHQKPVVFLRRAADANHCVAGPEKFQPQPWGKRHANAQHQRARHRSGRAAYDARAQGK